MDADPHRPSGGEALLMTGSGPIETAASAAPEASGSSPCACGVNKESGAEAHALEPTGPAADERDQPGLRCPVTDAYGRFGSTRDALGRWAPGNQAALGAGGHGGRRRELTDALMRAITVEDVGRVVRRLVADALAGDIAAAALLLAYGVGRPVKAEPDKTDGLPELLHQAHERWLGSAELIYGSEIRALKAENGRLRARASRGRVLGQSEDLADA